MSVLNIILYSILGLVLFVLASLDLFWTALPGCPTGMRRFPVTIGWFVIPIWFVIGVTIRAYCIVRRICGKRLNGKNDNCED